MINHEEVGPEELSSIKWLLVLSEAAKSTHIVVANKTESHFEKNPSLLEE